MKKYFSFILLFSLICLSCEDILEEVYYGPKNVPLENRVNATYVILKDWYGKELGYDLSEAGTDLFTWGIEHKLKEMMTYEPDFDAENPRLCILWSDLYKAIESCNSTIEQIKINKEELSQNVLNKWEAEVRFLRAHYYWLIVETWGQVHFTVEATTSPEYEAYSFPIDTFHAQIIKDLNFAVNKLNNITTNVNEIKDYGRITEVIARAFRARMYLAQGDYNSALQDALQVIDTATERYFLYLSNSYTDLWTIEGVEDNSEIIWALNYSTRATSTMNIFYQDVLTFCNTSKEIYPSESYNGNSHETNGGGGFWGHLFFTMGYDLIPGMKRESYNRPYRRYIPTKYFVNLFDDNDQRYESTFRFVFYANDPEKSYKIPRWPAYNIDDGSIFYPNGVADSNKLVYTPSDIPFKGDTAILLTNKNIPDSLLVTIGDLFIHKYGHFIVLDSDMLYTNEGIPTSIGVKVKNQNLNREIYIGLKKFADPTLESGQGVEGSTRSGRDVPIIRLSEMYLIVAECLYRLGASAKEGDAYEYLKILFDHRAVNHDGEELLQNYGINTVNDLTKVFFLEERAREFSGEQLRWFDLKRMHRNDDDFDMVEWIKSKNPDAKLMKEYHINRPIPQMQINAMRNPEVYYRINQPYVTVIE